MVVNAETHEILHPLEMNAEETYRAYLTQEANKIIFRCRHPFLHFLYMISDTFFLRSLEKRLYDRYIRVDEDPREEMWK